MWESFNATCPHGSVILMVDAYYGRMFRGRCIQDLMEIGCKEVITLYCKK